MEHRGERLAPLTNQPQSRIGWTQWLQRRQACEASGALRTWQPFFLLLDRRTHWELALSTVVDGLFEWDSSKNQYNVNEHGISFTEAKSLFRKTSLRRAAKMVSNEIREMFVGEPNPPVQKKKGRPDNIWKVIFTIVRDKSGNPRFRIISCHDASMSERADYLAFSGKGAT